MLYDCEEIEAGRNGLGRIERELAGLAGGRSRDAGRTDRRLVEAGCQGTLRVVVSRTGRRAHSARSWLGDNAIHAAGEVLARLAGVSGRAASTSTAASTAEGLQAVRIAGGVAGNVVPDACVR